MLHSSRLSALLGLLAVLAFTSSPTARAQTATSGEDIPLVTLHPPLGGLYACREHAEGTLTQIRDARGQDCLVAGASPTDDGRQILGLYRGDGLENEDYYGWRQPVLAPFDGVVVGVTENALVNRPGQMPTERALPGGVEFERADGVRVAYGHLREIAVAPGDTVRAGEPVGLVGNNGTSMGPHVHIGAWRGEEPLQIRWDLRAMGRLQGAISDDAEPERE